MARARRENPESELQKYPVEIIGGLAGVLAALIGGPALERGQGAGLVRLGGALFIASGAYSLYKGRNLVGGLYEVVGFGTLFLPEIKSALASKPPAAKQLTESSKPPIYNIALRSNTWDEDIGGGWVLLDAQDIRDPKLDPDRDVHVGGTVSLILQHGGRMSKADPKVFDVKVLNITGDDYAGQWLTGAPAGGPQMIDFRGAHIFTYHR